MYGNVLEGLVVILAGLVVTLGSIFEWVWFMSLSRSWNPYDVIRAPSIRLFYAAVGTGMTGIGIGSVLRYLLATPSDWMFVVGFVASTALSLLLLGLRNWRQKHGT